MRNTDSLLKIDKQVLSRVEDVMIEDTGIISQVQLMKIIHVELPDKRSKSIMSEISRQ